MAEIKINMDSLKTYRKAIRHKIKEGSNIFRMCPPFGGNCEGYPYAFWSVIWGLKDPATGNSKPYADCKAYEGKSPIWDYLDLLRAKIETLKAQMLAEGKTEEQVKERFKETNKFISDIRPKTAFAWNAIDKAGTVGILEIKTTAHKQIVKLMNQYILDYNQDPTSLGSEASNSGVWFDISRSGSSFDTEYNVKKNQTMIKNPATGIPSYQDDRQPIPETVVNDYQNHGYDLTTLYTKKTYDELRDILVANLAVLSDQNPDLYIEEFAAKIPNNSIKPMAKPSVALEVKQPAVEAIVPQGVKPVEIKLALPSSAQESEDDLLRMAENMFNS